MTAEELGEPPEGFQPTKMVSLKAERGYLSNYARDNFIAPYMSAFSSPSIKDMTATDPQQSHWLSNFILNSMLGYPVKPPSKQYIFNFLRRAEAAFREYELARVASLDFVGSRPAASKYMITIHHWEQFLAQSWEAYALLGKLTGKRLFEKDDGSPHNRLNRLYNRSKHTDKAIASGQLPTEEGTLGVWLTNDGLASTDDRLAFDEITEILEELSRFASKLQAPGG